MIAQSCVANGPLASISIGSPAATLAGFALPGLLALLATGLLISWLGLVWLTVTRLTRPPRRTAGYAITRGLPQSPAEISVPGGSPLRFTSWPLRTADGYELPVWDIVGRNEAGPTVIFSHGWGESRWTASPRIAALAGCCSRIIAYDLRGHGESPSGMRCALGTREADDLVRLIETVCREPKSARSDGPPAPDSPAKLVLYGFSLGAGVGIAAAADQRAVPHVTMVIAEAPYRLAETPARAVLRVTETPYRTNTTPAVATAILLFGGGHPGRSRRNFDRSQLAARLTCPLVVIHGDADEVCPAADGQSIAAAARDGQFFPVVGAGHLDLWQPQFLKQTAELLRKALQ